MSTSIDEYETAIAAYRAQLRAEAELADGDLDEIEDHLRALTDDLRERGMPVATAVSEAARRLGDPRAVAREHSRVRSAFGSRLSALRTWSVVALLVPMLVYTAFVVYPHVGLWNHLMLEYAAGVALAGALVLRMGWARPILLGGIAFFLVPQLLVTYAVPGVSPLYLVWHLGMLAFLVPWRRNELTASGLALAAYVWAYGAASWSLAFQVTTPDGIEAYMAPAGLVACAGTALAAAGAILRARWSSIAGVGAALALGAATYEVLGMTFRFDHPTVMQLAIVGSLGTGTLAALVGSTLAWRTARSRLGSLRAIRS